MLQYFLCFVQLTLKDIARLLIKRMDQSESQLHIILWNSLQNTKPSLLICYIM